jgi:hypothetical protein
MNTDGHGFLSRALFAGVTEWDFPGRYRWLDLTVFLSVVFAQLV